METRSIMMTAAQPFPLPRQLPPTLASIHQYWKLLIRAENPMPFSDDVTLGPIEKLSPHLMLIDVFSVPQRFRFSRLGGNIIGKLSNDLTGQFADEIKPAEPLSYFIAQASATNRIRRAEVVFRYPREAAGKGLFSHPSGVGQWSHRSPFGCSCLILCTCRS
jgi:hypothetical protein